MDEDFYIVIASFCDQNKILQYLEEFRDFLDSTDDVILMNKINSFSKLVCVLDKSSASDLLQAKELSVNDKFQSFTDDFNISLLQILELFCKKHSRIILHVEDNIQNFTERAVTLDIIVYLIKKFINDTNTGCYIQSLIETICCFLTQVKQKLACYTVISESELAPLFFTTLKFLAKVFHCIPIDKQDYICENDIVILLNCLPFTDSTTVKLFVNHILPAILKLSKESLQVKILMHIWQEVCLQFQLNEDHDEEEASKAYSCVYTLLCCLSESIYRNRLINAVIHEEAVFWKVVMAGLVSTFPFTRKKSLNVFKMFLAWVTQVETSNVELVSAQSKFSKFRKDMRIWNDVVTMFESLEEKQIHVIKPVLPKFARILQLTTKESTNLLDKTVDYPISCILTALVSRMLKHETKFVVKWALSTVLTLDFMEYNFNKYDDWLVRVKVKKLEFF